VRKAIIIPVLIGALIAVAFATTSAYRVPTYAQAFTANRPASVKTVEFVVTGVRCRGTSAYFASKISEVPGVLSVTTYARTNSALVDYDPLFVTPEVVQAAYEVPDTIEGRVYQLFTTRSRRELP
jgi:hypothetical protein